MIYHLWWHPHNFGAEPEYCLRFLERVLKHFEHLAQTQGMRSASMLEIAREWAASERFVAEQPAARVVSAGAGREVAGATAAASHPSHGLAALPKEAVRG
jgi:hypothetical protein